MAFTNLPSELLWIVLEYHISSTLVWYYPMYADHPAHPHLTWGAMNEVMTNVHFEDLEFLVITGEISGGQTLSYYQTALTITSLLRSVCKGLKKCIDYNCYFSEPPLRLRFKKRDYVIKRYYVIKS